MGGGDAAAASMATGRLAITFNPASVSYLTEILHGLNHPANIVNNISSKEINGTPITSDPLTIIQKATGFPAPGANNYVIVGGSWYNLLEMHSIDRLVEALSTKNQ